MAEAFAATGGATESPFEDAVKAALEARGWVVHPQIGVSGFRVDLGVVDPDAPGRYLAGVECDGASYHRSATARDRDRLRESVLTQLGWRIRRVWSTDWWMDADAAFERLQQALEADVIESRRLVAIARAADVVALPPTGETAPEAATDTISSPEAASDDDHTGATEPADPAVEVPAESGEPIRRYADATPLAFPRSGSSGLLPEARAYRVAEVSESGHLPDGKQFYDLTYRGTLRAMVAHVIAVEAPIYDDVLVQRLARAHGFSRAAAKIREIVLSVVSSNVARIVDGDRAVLWPDGQGAEPRIAYRRGVDGARDHADVPLSELAGLAHEFLSGGAGFDETIRMMAQTFELGRLRESAKARFEAAAAVASSMR